MLGLNLELPKVNTGPFRFGVSKATKPSDWLEREQARRNLLDFTRYTMPTFEQSWHHVLMCEYLDAFARLDITRLIISMPPRHTKSELVSRRLPAFILGQDPDAPIIAASYGADLARRMNRDVQRIMDDAPYRSLFPNTKLFGSNIRTVAQGTWMRNSDMFEVVEYNGYYRGAGVGGAITGMGMKYGIIDDPLKNRADANSETIRQKIWDWYTSTFRTRLAPGGGILITATRWHEDDLIGRLLAQSASDPKADQWTVLTLPAIAEDEGTEYDPRQPGDALWPARFDLAELTKTRVSLGAYDWNSLYQQRPMPLEGGMFKRSDFKIVAACPNTNWRIRYWDKAASISKSAKYSAGVRLSIAQDGGVYIEDTVRGQWETRDRRQVMLQTAQLDRQKFQGDTVIFIEQEPGSSGLDSVTDEIRMLSGFAAFADRPSGDKDTRMLPVSAQAQIGNLYLVAGDWNEDFINELCAIPNGRYRDQADAASGAFNRLIDIINAQPDGVYVHDEAVSISPY